jgi:hypothetical protein
MGLATVVRAEAPWLFSKPIQKLASVEIHHVALLDGSLPELAPDHDDRLNPKLATHAVGQRFVELHGGSSEDAPGIRRTAGHERVTAHRRGRHEQLRVEQEDTGRPYEDVIPVGVAPFDVVLTAPGAVKATERFCGLPFADDARAGRKAM